MFPSAPDRVDKQEVFKAKGAAFSKFKFSVELTPTEVRALNDEWGLVLCSVRGMLTPQGEGDVVQVLFRAIRNSETTKGHLANRPPNAEQ
jgi:hypothetical protein